MNRRVSQPLFVGDVKIGGDSPISVQSMTKTDTRDIKSTVDQIKRLEEVGCQIIRCAVPDMEAAKSLKSIKSEINIPLVADIHFHYQLALEALNSGADCLRLNPGNIRDKDRVTQIASEAKLRNVPIRIGVNFGSLPPVGGIGKTRGTSRHIDGVNLLPTTSNAQDSYSLVDHMVDTGLWEIGILENLDFDLIKISLKAFDIETTVESYRRLSKMVPYPMHLGITEAGTAKSGSIRSAIGIGSLLYEGIGDTIRVSLSDEPEEEIYTGIEILKALNLRKEGPILVACPSCGRADVDIRELANKVDSLIKDTKTHLKIAVMGCEVNGPGEAKDADIGIAAGVGRAVIFTKGKKTRVVEESEMLNALMEEIKKHENAVSG
ncbi:MAG: 4-hydroxy-3-methylbut-2-en-1-yl diphosphate synthase [Dehalococcoidia bacterium]|nr:4-hydroxy-3-methylbut-2-en-1-yl diphosphate synthase [Dehalococcoidia bacterium]|tara:strand:+ start:1034 stop:2167 length:1134 start_codon:yes stop_codon:yes gene_type:complete